MENMKTKKGSEGSKLKERHIVSWSQEEDDILREQIRVHGTENWSIIASKFKDKTTRQCRRRWFTYLNSDFKKGGWSPEEDMLLCEAQKIYGNRWTEIAKVVSGRTDNAVKNRFTTLCKKRAKQEALTKENKNSYINSNNKRVIFPNAFDAAGILDSLAPAKKPRMTTIDVTENIDPVERLASDCGRTENPKPRVPLAVLTQNFQDVANLSSQDECNITQAAANEASNEAEGTFLKKDDPRMLALMQQAELLGSLAVKVNTDSTQQTLENAWKVLQDFLGQNKERNTITNISDDMDFEHENFKDLINELSSNEGSRLSWRQPDLYEESPGSSEYSTGSTILSQTAADKTELSQVELCSSQQCNFAESQSTQVEDQNGTGDLETGVLSAANQDILPSCADLKDHDEILSPFSIAEFASPIQVTPIFRSLAAGVPSPKFSESERQFLLKTLGVESPSCNPSNNNTSQPPPCKRSLLQSL